MKIKPKSAEAEAIITKALLLKFGAHLCRVDPNVIFTHNGELFNFNSIQWKWLEPLLVDLAAYRSGSDFKNRKEKSS